MAKAPLLSIVVPVHNTEAYLSECLDSLLDQSLRELEVICVDDGSTDGSREILHRYARRDPRVIVIEQGQSGQGAARNAAVRRARGTFLTFCDSDDTVPPTAYETMVRTLESTGSDFVLGMARRFRAGVVGDRCWPEVHDKTRYGTSVDDFPAAMRDIIACNRVIRTSFWRDRVGGFPEGVAYEDHLPMLACTVRADRFDVLTAVTYNWRKREDGTSTSQQKHATANLIDRLAALDQARELLWAENSVTVQQAWVSRVLDIDLPLFIPYALTADKGYRTALADRLRKIFALAEPDQVLDTAYGRRVWSWLAAHERWEDVDTALEHFRHVDVPPRTRVVGADLIAVDDLPFAPDLPAWLRRLSPIETAMIGVVTWVGIDGSDLVIHGAAIVPGLDTDENAPTLVVQAHRGEQVIDGVVSPRPDPELDEWLGHRHTRYTRSGFTSRLALDQLTTAAADHPWSVSLRLRIGDLERSDQVTRAQPGSAAAAWGPGQPAGPVLARLADTGLMLEPAGALTGAGQTHAAHGPVVHEVSLDARGLVLQIEPGPEGESEWSEATLTATGRVLRPRSVDRVGDRVQVVFPTELSLFDSPPTPLGTGRWKLTPTTAIAPQVAALLPHSIWHEQVRVVLRQAPQSPQELRLHVVPPLRDEERGQVGHEKARRHAFSAETTPLEAVLFWPPRGPVFPETWRVLDHALRRREDWSGERIWGLHDSSTALPPGVRGVVIGSSEWYHALSRARYVLTSHTPPPWARKAAHQRWLHLDLDVVDEPFGIAAMAARHATEHRMRSAAQWTADLWDGLITASAAGADLARSSRRWQGPVLPLGDPRSDELRDPATRRRIRAETRASLGIAADTPVLLYLPERRERLTDALPVRPGTGELNLSLLASRTGQDWLVLRHGSRWRRLAPSPQLREVSEHPRPSHLMCAADVAVLERTEARLLWPLTEQPCLVHLPGSQEERSVPVPRGHAAPPAPANSFPGPVVSDLSEAVTRLGDLDELARVCRAIAPEFLAHWQSAADGGAAERIISALLD